MLNINEMRLTVFNSKNNHHRYKKNVTKLWGRNERFNIYILIYMIL